MERYSRQLLFSGIGNEGQHKLMESRVLVVGCGALGTVISNHLARSGVGTIKIVDRDYVEFSNLQRQMLFDESDAEKALPKAVAAEEKLKKINSEITIEGIVANVELKNIDDLLHDVDIVIDGTDNFETRFLLNDACYKKGIPFVYGGAVSSRGMSAIFIPEVTPCLRCFIASGDESGQTCDSIGVISPIVDIVASYQVVEALKFLTDQHSVIRKSIMTMDIWNNRYHELSFENQKEDCPTCMLKQYPALEKKKKKNKDKVTVLCGRDTVQIQTSNQFDLEELNEKFQIQYEVTKTPFLLRVKLNEHEKFVIFPDGRLLIQGTKDIDRAHDLFNYHFH
jgi:molybdopterin-synthase adenylyltransferase